MRLVVVGATGTIGTAVCQLLREQHEILAVGHRQGDHTVDIKDPNSIAKLFERIGLFDGSYVRPGTFLSAISRRSATAKCASALTIN
jgi:nucleoside-diphosphate-sugar epimerase